MTTSVHSVPCPRESAEPMGPRFGPTTPGPEMPQRNNSTSLRRALRVLDAVSGYRGRPCGISLTSLAVSLEMSKSTVLRLIGPLRDEELIHQDRDSGRYRLGPAAVRLGAAFVERVDLDVLAGDLLRELARRSGRSATLVVPGSGDDSHRQRAGAAVLLAVGTPVEAVADRDIRIAASLRERGWWAEISDGDTGDGSVAAPVVDHRSRVVAAVESSLRSVMCLHPAGADDPRSSLESIGDAVRTCADSLSGRLGAPRVGSAFQKGTTR